MPWLMSLDDVEDICEEIERALNACGNASAIAIVRHKFCADRKCYYIRPEELKAAIDSNLRPVDVSYIVGASRAFSSEGSF
jgi:hypothetical protein